MNTRLTLLPLLLLMAIIWTSTPPVWAQSQEGSVRIERSDVQGFMMKGPSLRSKNLRLTFLQHKGEALPSGKRREQGRVSWTHAACGGGCYTGEGAELPITFAAIDTLAGRMVLTQTVWTQPDGRFDVVLPPPSHFTGSASTLGEYVLMLRTEQARDLPAAARRLLEAAPDGP